MGKKSSQSLVDVAAVVRLANSATAPQPDSVQARRQIVADLCKLIGSRIRDDSQPSVPRDQIANRPAAPLPPLSPRTRQTLDRLLAGDSEKQIARALGLSRHTVHVYVKALYRGFNVNSRGELLALFVRPIRDAG